MPRSSSSGETEPDRRFICRSNSQTLAPLSPSAPALPSRSLPLRTASRLSDRREDGTSIEMKCLGSVGLFELRRFDLCACALRAAV
jgi:hypothetical protein